MEPAQRFQNARPSSHPLFSTFRVSAGKTEGSAIRTHAPANGQTGSFREA